MKDKNYIRELLYRSLDVALSPKEEQDLADGLIRFPAIETERKQLLRMRDALARMEVSATPAGFSESILAKKQRPRMIYLQSWAPQIAAACVILVLAFIFSIYFGEGSLDLTSVLGVEELSPEEAYTLLNY
jgi:hypothetical protein